MNEIKEQAVVRETIIEGKAQAFTVETERKLMQKINNLYQRLDGGADSTTRIQKTAATKGATDEPAASQRDEDVK